MKSEKPVVVTARARVPGELAERAMDLFQSAIDSLRSEVRQEFAYDLFKKPVESPSDFPEEHTLVELGYDRPVEPSNVFDPWED